MTIREQVISRVIEVGNLKKGKGRMSMAVICKEAGISPVSFSRWINGHTSMQDNNVEKVCNVLKIEFIRVDKNINNVHKEK